MKLIFLDTETTGNDITKDRLCQICYKVDDVITTEYFKPPVPISIKSMSITHITNKMVADKPAFLDSRVHQELVELLKDHILVAHNARFDIGILKAEGIEVPQYICTLRLIRYLDSKAEIPEYNLQFLRYYHDFEIEGNAHDAEGDVKVLEQLFNKLLTDMTAQFGDRETAIKKMIEISSTPTLYTSFNFGKFRDKTVAEVAQIAPDYLKWLLDQKLQNSPDDEDWIYTLSYYLKLNPNGTPIL